MYMPGTTTRTEITCKKISGYMHDLAFRWCILKYVKHLKNSDWSTQISFYELSNHIPWAKK